jgi:CDP-paratose 2-epimerase
MNILVTGGAGFVGGNLAVNFANKGHSVLCIDNLSRRGSELNLSRFRKYKNIEFRHCDIRCVEDFYNFDYFNPDVVLECSAQTTAIDGYKNPSYDFTNNTVGAYNVLEYCRRKNAGLIFWSSNKAYSGEFCNSIPMKETETRLVWDEEEASKNKYLGWSIKGFSEKADMNGNTHTVYGATKNAADLLCQEWSKAFDVPVIVNRFSCLYGSHQFGKVSQGWIVWFAIAKKMNKQLYYYGNNGKQVRDYLHVDDLACLIGKQIQEIEKYSGNYYNVGGGINNTTSLVELSNYLDTIFKNNKKIISLEKPRPSDQKIYISDITKVSNDFGWTPEVSIEQGLDQVKNWLDGSSLEWV